MIDVIDEHSQPMKISRVDISITIIHFLIKISATLTIENETNLDREGNLSFPLSDCTICGYALDFGDEMVQAVVVNPEKARVTFDEEERVIVKERSEYSVMPMDFRPVTHSVAEVAYGNVYDVRIYPVPKHGRRVVRIEMQDELSGDGVYKFPLGYSDAIDVVTIDILYGETLKVSRIETDIRSSDVRGSNKFSCDGQNVTINRGIDIFYTDYGNCAVQRFRDTYYFAIKDIMEEEEIELSNDATRKLIGIYWDTSYSRTEDNLSLGLKVVEEMCRQINLGEIHLFIFRHQCEEKRTFTINGKCDKLLSYLSSIPYDSASNLAALEYKSDYDFYLLFTDGFHNVSENPNPSTLETPIHVIITSQQYDIRILERLSLKSGGSLNIISESTNIEGVITGIMTSHFSLISVDYDQEIIRDIFPSMRTQISNGMIKLAGIITILDPENLPSITLNFGHGTQITKSATYYLNIDSNIEDNDMIGRYWAQQKISELELYEQNDEFQHELYQTGKQFTLVSDHTSLLILESLNQYLKFKVEPPDSLPQIKDQYLAIIKEQEFRYEETKAQIIMGILGFWSRRVNWWNEDKTDPEHSEFQVLHHMVHGKGVDLNPLSPSQMQIYWSYISKRNPNENSLLEYEIYIESRYLLLKKTLSPSSTIGQIRKLLNDEFQTDCLLFSTEKNTYLRDSLLLNELRLSQKSLLILKKYERKITIYAENGPVINYTITEITKVSDLIDENCILYGLGHPNDLDFYQGAKKMPRGSVVSYDESIRYYILKKRDFDLYSALLVDNNVRINVIVEISNIEILIYSVDMDLIQRISSSQIDDFLVHGNEISLKCNDLYLGNHFIFEERDIQNVFSLLKAYKRTHRYNNLERQIDLKEILMPSISGNTSMLNLCLEKTGEILPLKFSKNMMIGDFLQIIERKLPDYCNHALLRYSTPSKTTARWLNEDTTFNYYDISHGEEIYLIKKHRYLAVRLKDGSTQQCLVDYTERVESIIRQITSELKFRNPEEYSLSKENNMWTLSENRTLCEQGVTFDDVLTLSKKYFHSDGSIDTSNPDEIHLLFIQMSIDVVKGKIVIAQEEIVHLSALHIQSEIGNYDPSLYTSLNLEKYISVRFINKKTESNIISTHKSLVGLSRNDAIYRYIQIVRQSPFYGCSFFKVQEIRKQQKKTVNIGIAKDRIIRVDFDTGKILEEFALINVKRWATVKGNFIIDFGDHRDDYYRILTPEGEQISFLISSYIDIIISRRRHTALSNCDSGEIAQIGSVSTISPQDVEKDTNSIPIDPIRISRLGSKKVIWHNFYSFCDSVNRDAEHVVRYLSSELGINCTTDQKNQLIIKGRFTAEIMEIHMKKYIGNFVSCNNCMSFNTTIQRKLRVDYVVCQSCNSRIAKSIKNGFSSWARKRTDLLYTEEHSYQTIISTIDSALKNMDDLSLIVKQTKSITLSLREIYRSYQQNIPHESIIRNITVCSTSITKLVAELKENGTSDDARVIFINLRKSIIMLHQMNEAIHDTENENSNISMPVISLKDSDIEIETNLFRYQESKDPLFLYTTYLEQMKSKNINSDFIISTAANFLSEGHYKKGIRVLLNLAEMELRNKGYYLRKIVYILLSYNIPEVSTIANSLLRRLIQFRPEEPQSYLDLSVSLFSQFTKYNEQNLDDLKESIGLLNSILSRTWDKRFSQIEMVCLMEYNRIYHWVKDKLPELFNVQYQTDFEKRFIHTFELDLRISIHWDTDKTDVELHVEEPSGEICYSMHNKTTSGGMLSKDFSYGYGPEEYLIRSAEKGQYKIRVKLHSNIYNKSPTTVLIRIITNFGKPNELTLNTHTTLTHPKELHEVAYVTFK